MKWCGKFYEMISFPMSPIFFSLSRPMFYLFLSPHPPISLIAYADVLAISFPDSLIFLCLPRVMFYLFLSSHPPISLVAYADVLAISLPASLIFLGLPRLMFYLFLSSHPPISLVAICHINRGCSVFSYEKLQSYLWTQSTVYLYQ